MSKRCREHSHIAFLLKRSKGTLLGLEQRIDRKRCSKRLHVDFEKWLNP